MEEEKEITEEEMFRWLMTDGIWVYALLIFACGVFAGWVKWG